MRILGETFSQTLWVLFSAVVSSIARATTGTIKVPEGLDGRIKEIRATCVGTVETVVNGGGLVEITNDAVKGMECSFALGGQTSITEGGHSESGEQLLKVDYPLVGGSTFTIHYTPYDDQAQVLEVEMTYEKNGKPDEKRPNHVKADMVLKASAISQITVDEEHNSIDIPKGHGGILQATEIIVFPTLETVVTAGGKIKLDSTVDAWKPFEQFVGGLTALGASGGGLIRPNRRITNKILSGNSKVTLDYTPIDNQSQSLGLTLFWRGKDPT